MSLAELLLGKDNPVTQWTGRNANLLTGLGTSLLSDGMNFAPAQQGAALDRQAAAQKDADAKLATQTNATKQWLQQNYPDLAQAVDAGLPVSDAWGEAFKRESGGGTGDFKTGFTPVWGTYDGHPATVLPGNDGQFYINGQPIDPAKFIPTNPYDLNAQKAGGAAFGKATGGAQFTVPNAQLELDQSKAAIDNLKTDPNVKAGMEDWFNQWGVLPRGVWVQGGSNMAQFRNSANNVIDRSWLSARAALKGGGQITDYEGAKAENAVSMMKSALDSGDKGQFEKARDDYEYWVQQGFTKLQQQAGGIPGYGSGAAAAPDPNNIDDLLGKYGQ